MKVILLTDIPKVGKKYDVKDFKEGYAENVLLAKGLAILATTAELAKIEDRKKKMERQKSEEMQTFMNLIAKVGNQVITISAKANDKGHLFRSISPLDVIKAIKNESGVEVEESSLIMGHIKSLGIHTIKIKKGDKSGECQIKVEAI